EPLADGAAGTARLAPREGLGAGHRCGDPGAGSPGPAVGGDPVGAGRAVVASAARGHADHRQRAPEPAVRLPRVLRLPAVLPGKRAAGGGRRAAGGLAAAVSTRWARYVAVGDSMTEGLWDPYSISGGTAAGGVQAVAPEAVDSPAEPGEAPLRGWADRLALALSERRIADGGAPLE